jgi:hypothetical protein
MASMERRSLSILLSLSLATNELNDGADYTTPAVSGGRIFIKGKSFLWCIGTK